MPSRTVPGVRRVVLKNFKSIESCDVHLGPLTLLVGPNGAGKSNLIDALALTSDALNSTLENALRERGGLDEVRRRSRGHPRHFGVRIEMVISAEMSVNYAYQVAAGSNRTFNVQREECEVWVAGRLAAWFRADGGSLTTSIEELATLKLVRSSLALPLLSAVPEFQQAQQAIANLGYYSFNMEKVRGLQDPDAGLILRRDGGNLASVIRRMHAESPRTVQRVVEYLAAVVPGIRGVAPRSFGPKEAIEFRQDVEGSGPPFKYLASNVSDGTLRALSVLMAVFQESDPPVLMVSIEEPEVAIHPGAALRLMDGLLEASRSRQLLLTTHSPDLLDHPKIEVDSVVAVQSSQGTSEFGPVEATTRQAVKDNLYTVGELLRLEQVKPHLFSADRQHPKLF